MLCKIVAVAFLVIFGIGLCLIKFQKMKPMDIAATMIATISLIVSGLTLYFTELRQAKIEISPVTKLALFFARAQDNPNLRRTGLVVFLSTYNVGKKPAWIDNIIVTVEHNSKVTKMSLAGLLPLEKYGPNMKFEEEFIFPNYPLVIAPDSGLSYALVLAAPNQSEDIEPQIKYHANLRINYGKYSESVSFDFKIDRPKEYLDKIPFGSFYDFVPIGVNRPFIPVGLGN